MSEVGPLRCWIRLGRHDYELRTGQTLVGRHDSCHIVLDDVLASRRHAVLHFEDGRVSVEDLGSVNGVIVNGRRIRNTQNLASGDELKLGNQLLSVHLGAPLGARPSRNRVGATTLARLPGQLLDEDEKTIIRDEATLGVLAGAGAKALALGKVDHAEAIVSKSLFTIREHVRSQRRVDDETIELAATQAMRIAQAAKKPPWLDYAVSLYAYMGRVMPGPVVELLYETVRQVPDFELSALRQYVERLQEQQDAMTPSERFLLRRLEGLLSRLSG